MYHATASSPVGRAAGLGAAPVVISRPLLAPLWGPWACVRSRVPGIADGALGVLEALEPAVPVPASGADCGGPALLPGRLWPARLSTKLTRGGAAPALPVDMAGGRAARGDGDAASPPLACCASSGADSNAGMRNCAGHTCWVRVSRDMRRNHVISRACRLRRGARDSGPELGRALRLTDKQVAGTARRRETDTGLD